MSLSAELEHRIQELSSWVSCLLSSSQAQISVFTGQDAGIELTDYAAKRALSLVF
jgi:hypothetical protein